MKHLLLLSLLVCVAVSSRADWHSDSQTIMGTTVSVILWHEDEALAVGAITAVMDEMRRIDALWNPDDPASELYWINEQAAVNPVAVSPELVTVIDKALYFSELTDGAFDISFASIGRYYDYRAARSPEDQRREQALLAVDYRLITLKRREKQLSFGHPQLKIDLGGIAKGYAVDRALVLLQEHGVEHGSVSAGGDTGLLGDRRGRPWMVGIRNPRSGDDVALALPLEDLAISTSGDYERFFIDPDSGERIHHIINPRTGKSASGVISASVLGPSGFDTDPLSTAIFVMGVDDGMALIETLPEFDAIVIDADGVVHYSSGLVE